MIVRGIAHAVAFTYVEEKHHYGAGMLLLHNAQYLQPYCVGVLQAAVIPLIQNVQTSALIICAVGSTGDLRHTGKLKQHDTGQRWFVRVSLSRSPLYINSYLIC